MGGFSIGQGPAGPQGPAGSQTPWTQNINGGGFILSNVGTVKVKDPVAASISLQFGVDYVWWIGTSRSGYLDIGGTGASLPANGAICTHVSGNVGIATANPTISGTGKIHCSGDTARITDTSRTPANSAAPGNDGEICFDSGFVYIHSGGSWRRAALTTF